MMAVLNENNGHTKVKVDATRDEESYTKLKELSNFHSYIPQIPFMHDKGPAKPQLRFYRRPHDNSIL